MPASTPQPDVLAAAGMLTWGRSRLNWRLAQRLIHLLIQRLANANANQPVLPLVDIRRGRRLVLWGAATGALRVAVRRSGVGLRSSVRSEKRRELPCRRSAEKKVWNHVRMPSTALASRHCSPKARVRVAW